MTRPETRTFETTMDEFAHDLVVAILNLELHSPYSPAVQDNVAAILRHLRDLTSDDHPNLRLEFRGDELVLAGRVLVGASLQARKLIELADERELAAIVFDRRITQDELLRFLVLFTSSDVTAFERANLDAALEKSGVRQLRIEKRAARKTKGGSSGALRGYQDLADCLQDSHVAASRGESLSIDRTAGVVEQALAQMDREPSALLSLAYYDDIDSFTVGHSIRVSLLALQVARAAGCCEHDLMRVGTAALLHDIGKSRIPQDVLFKRGPLSDEEWAIMAAHPRLGAEILIEQPDVDPTAIGAAFCHHMAEGTSRGYPTPALAFQPSTVSKIVRICDVFEALTSVRPYKPALSPVEAYAIMHRKPGDFDPGLLQFFVDAIGLYPLGTRMLLTTGERARVIGRGARRDRPRVELTTTPDGHPVEDGAPSVIDIGTEVEGVTREIDRVVSGQRGPKAPHDPKRCC